MARVTPRPLTTGEAALARSVFGDTIDYARVTITDKKYMPFQPQGTAMAPNGHLYMYGCYKDDYSREHDGWKSHFIHEMTHVWQQQNNILNPVREAVKLSITFKFNYNAAYDYKLEQGKDLLAYNMEQQASIVQDYFMIKHCGHDAHRGHCTNTENTADKMALYENVLEDFLKKTAPPQNKNGGPKPPAV